MTPTDRAIVAAAEERDKAAAKAGWLRQTDPGKLSAHGDRHELLRIVREQEARIAVLEAVAEAAGKDIILATGTSQGQLKEALRRIAHSQESDLSVYARFAETVARDALAAPDAAADDPADRADAAAAERATAGKWK